jgi:hypothetical protein
LPILVGSSIHASSPPAASGEDQSLAKHWD